MMTIEMFPAGNGDCILVQCGRQVLLIDGGYVSTYRDHLKPRLQELSAEGLRINKMIVTHIDADHISGIIAFVEENGAANAPAVIPVDEVWFNSYRHLQITERTPDTYSSDAEKPDLGIRGGLESHNADDPAGLVSYKQGTTLGSLLLKYDYAWNKSFGGNAAKADSPHQLEIGGGVKLTLLGPHSNSLDAMAGKWKEYLRRRFQGRLNEDAFFDDAFELMMEEMRQDELVSATHGDHEGLVSGGADWVETYGQLWSDEDNSVTNGSSIIFLLEHDGQSALFLGDAIPGEAAGQLQKLNTGRQSTIDVDILKVAHHGAWPNNSPELIEMIHANQYLLSSNGHRHHHPQLPTLAQIIKSHRGAGVKTLVFNYRQRERLGVLDEASMKSKYDYHTIWPDVDEWGQGTDGYVKIEVG